MFERFTDRARRVLVLAQEEAGRLRHDHVGTEHLLLGMVCEGDGVGATALKGLGIELHAVREQVESRVDPGDGSVLEHPPFTPAAKQALELALREALGLSHRYIGTEHILLGLVRQGDGVAAQVLAQLGAGLAAVRSQVIRTLSGPPVPVPDEGEVPAPDAGSQAWQEVGWTLLASGTAAAWRALDLARQQAAVDAHEAVEVADLVLGVLRVDDPVVTAALVGVGAVGRAPADLRPEGPSEDGAPRPLSAPARDALVVALRSAEGAAGSLRPAHVLLGCLSVLDPQAQQVLATRLDTELGQLRTHLTERLGSGQQ